MILGLQRAAIIIRMEKTNSPRLVEKILRKNCRKLLCCFGNTFGLSCFSCAERAAVEGFNLIEKVGNWLR
jgi:hypothetical protein